MPSLLAICAGLSILTLLALGYARRSLRRRRLLRAGASGLTGLGSAAALGGFLVLLLSYISYQRLTHEDVIAKIEFAQTAPLEYRARFMVDGERDRFFTLAGDEWQVDARMVTWKPPATILGLKPLYRLERLSGRYTVIEREQQRPRTVHALSEPPFADVWSVARRAPILMPGVDAYYGNATYVPMADGAAFEISLSRDALIARPTNEPARAALGDWQ